MPGIPHRTAVSFMTTLAAAVPGAEPAPFPPSEWKGFAKHEFREGNQQHLVIAPKKAAPGRPWMWRAEFFGVEPQADLALLAEGWHIVHHPTAAGRFGSPSGVAAWEAGYQVLTTTYGLSPKPVLEGLSRGGQLALNWAIAHPDQVSGLYLDAPVCDIRSWPAGPVAGMSGPGGAAEWATCKTLFDLTDASIAAYDQGPLTRLAPLATAKVPILLICGDADTIVPYPENGKILEERYRALGGPITLILKPGVGHHPHSLTDPAPIVTFALEAFAGKR